MAFVSTSQEKVEELTLLQDFDISSFENDLQGNNTSSNSDILGLYSRQIPCDLKTFFDPTISCDHSLDDNPVSSYIQTLPNSSTVYDIHNNQRPTTLNNVQILHDSPGVKDTHAFYESPVIFPQETNQSILPVLFEEKNIEEDINICTMNFRQRLFTQKLCPSLHELPPQNNPSIERHRQKAKIAYKRRQNIKWDRKRMLEWISHLNHEASRLQRQLVELDREILTLKQRVNFPGSIFSKPGNNSCNNF